MTRALATRHELRAQIIVTIPSASIKVIAIVPFDRLHVISY